MTHLCVIQASAYGKCVTATTIGKQELQKDLCVKEFQALKTCFLNAVSTMENQIYGDNVILIMSYK